MMRCSFVLAVLFATGGSLSALHAQKSPPPTTQHPESPAPTTGGKLPPGAPQPAAPQPAQPPATAPATTPASVPQVPVTPQAARPAAGVSTGTYTAGLAIAPYTGTTTEDAWEYAARLGRMLDSTIVTLVGTFRNTSGQPMIGASSPTTLSQRERDRWAHCRDLYWDLTTYAAAAGDLRQSLGTDPTLQRAAADLDSAFAESAATAECDNVASMIAAPDRWTPWQDQYEAAAHHFYRDFYAEIREVHEKDRALVNTLNRFLPPAHRVAPLPGLPTNPPYAGAAP
jgi:hypothetical protein